MNPSREEKLFELALAKPVKERAVFPDEACFEDATLHQRLEAPLAVAGRSAALSLAAGATAPTAAAPPLSSEQKPAPPKRSARAREGNIEVDYFWPWSMTRMVSVARTMSPPAVSAMKTISNSPAPPISACSSARLNFA
jgi:hypothetical protein